MKYFQGSMYRIGAPIRQIAWSLIAIALFLIVVVRGTAWGVIGVRGRVLTGIVVLFFLPGYWLAKVLFRNTGTDVLEQGVVSVAFSLAVVPLLVYVANRLGLPLQIRTVLGVIVVLVASCICWLWRHDRWST